MVVTLRFALVSAAVFAGGCAQGSLPSTAQSPATAQSQGVADVARSAYKIYVANSGSSGSGPYSVTSYDALGHRTTPTITDGISAPFAVAVAANGTIYVSNALSEEITTYKPDGTRIQPTIHVRWPRGIAVDASGKIYVASYSGDAVRTYAPNGKRTTPTITGLQRPVGVAVDRAGKIYVANSVGNTITTYAADGSQTHPTIARGLASPQYVTVDSRGKIYVTNGEDQIATTYKADGTQADPTIGDLDGPKGIVVDPDGKIFIANFGRYAAQPMTSSGNTVTAFTRRGKAIEPIITDGVASPSGLALH